MIEVKIGGVSKWKVNEYTFTDPQMGIRSISMSVAHPSSWVDGVAPEVADFTGAYVEYEGEQFYLSSSKPSAEKNTSTIDYTYTLIFKGSEDELTRRKVRDLAEAGVDNYVSQGTVFSIYANINQFVQLLQNNLNYYYENAWTINLAGTSQDSVRIDINNVFLLDLLQKTYEYFGLRFKVSGHTITIGYEPEEIYHVFDYGGDGGLVNITRTAPDASIVNRISGTGGSRNVPVNYFSDTYSKFDPDPNPIAGLQRRITNIMPKVFRDSVINGDLPYIDYVEDAQSILIHGVREDALMPNEDIYPSIAGVSVAGLGRIDEIVAVEVPEVSDPEAEGYVGTFDIWVKDIGFNLADDKYTTTEEATISFTTGYVTGYDFIILAINGVRQVVEDTTKSYGGVQSKYKITLIRSDAELAISDMMLPNQTTSPNAGDNFVIYNINMPQSYVENAEQRVQDWLESNLAELKVEKPSYTIQPMDSFFVTAPLEFDGKSIASKLKSGNRLTVNNTKITNGAQLLYINNVTIQYGGALPKYSFTVTDKVTVEGGAISRLQSQLDGVMGRQLLTEKDIDALLSGFSTKFLSKIKPDTAQQLIQFLNGISVNNLSRLNGGAEFGNYITGLLGSGGRIDEFGRGELRSLKLWEFLEVPELRFNRVSVYTGVQWQTFGGGIIESVEIDKDEFGQELQSGIITLKLEEGEYGAVAVDDMCQGIYHNFGGANDTVSEDQRNGNFHIQGFRTSYFRITEILDTATNGQFRYVLRGTSERWNQLNHPSPYMHFACYANPSNTDRQACSYSTTEYSIRLHNMTTWEYGENNIYAIDGKLDGFQLGETVFTGTGQVIGNGYFYGHIQNIVNAPLEMKIDNGGDSFLAFGESMNIICHVFKGLKEVTSLIEAWSVTRESGNQAEDDAWNIDHQNFAGQITLQHGPTYSDLGAGLNTLFRFTASGDNDTAIYEMTI